MNSIHLGKASWLPRVPETIAHAQVRLDDTQDKTRIYIRRYQGGVNHAVVIRPDGTVVAQKTFTGHLETQFPIELLRKSRQQYLKTDWVATRIQDK